MKPEEFKNKKVTVMGLGFHDGGLGAVQFLVEFGAIVTVTDLSEPSKLADSLEKLKGLPIKLVLGKHEEDDFKNCDMVVRNPAVPATSPYLKIAKDNRIPIEMESSLFFKMCPSRHLIAVTGTKGKTTTSHLAAHVIKSAGITTYLLGNMGKSMLNEIKEIRENDFVVLELSSYQCEGFEPFLSQMIEQGLGPQFGIITNIFPDHLNRYSSITEYAQAKKNLLLTQSNKQFAIINNENSWADFFKKGIQSQIIEYDEKTLNPEWGLKLLGTHNRLNAGAVYLLAKKIGLDDQQIKNALETFRGVEHRLEIVKSLEGIDFYNDSTATNPSAALEGIKTIAATGRSIVLIVGGNDKNMDFSDFVNYINDHRIRCALLIGSADEKLKNISHDLIVGQFDNLENAVRAAFKTAVNGGVVMLSPGATSFNMFRDEFDRGRQFKEIVHNL